jgi:uncharacterized membrane-anchored protein
MTLRILKPRIEEAVGAASEGDDWGSRIAKLIPAEALGLYGSAVALIKTPDPAVRNVALWVIVAVCCGLTIFLRYRATLDPQSRRPQWTAILVSVVSFILWLTALGAPTTPISLPDSMGFVGPLLALLWGTIVPYFYRG